MNDDLVANFVAVTGSDESQAISMLEATGYSLEEAVQLFFAAGPQEPAPSTRPPSSPLGGAAAGGGGHHDDDDEAFARRLQQYVVILITYIIISKTKFTVNFSFFTYFSFFLFLLQGRKRCSLTWW